MRIARGLCVAVFFLSLAAAQPRIVGVVNGASFQQLVAPGSFATAAVQDLQVSPTAASSPSLPYTLAGVTATVNNQAAALYYARSEPKAPASGRGTGRSP